MQVSKIELLVKLLNQAVTELGWTVLQDVDAMAIMIHRTMTAQARSYHTVGHVFRLAECAGPIRTLAGLFHDLVYYQVDKGIPPEIFRAVFPRIEERVEVFSPAGSTRKTTALPAHVAGVRVPGRSVSAAAGLNEFSARR